jgi:hypothetical protein
MLAVIDCEWFLEERHLLQARELGIALVPGRPRLDMVSKISDSTRELSGIPPIATITESREGHHLEDE